MCNQLSKKIFNLLTEYRKFADIDKNESLEKKLALLILAILLNFDLVDDSTKISIDSMRKYVTDIYSEISDMFQKHNGNTPLFGTLDEIKYDVQSITKTTIETIETDYCISKERADFISRNITNKYNNSMSHLRAKKIGARFHIWRSEMDGRERVAHREANGQKKPIDEPFDIGDFKMMFPMDESYGASVKQIMNCRCVETFSMN